MVGNEGYPPRFRGIAPLWRSLRRALDGGILAIAVGACHGAARGTPAEICPVAPSQGASCFTDGLRCTTGDSPRPECRAAWTCRGGSFVDTSVACPAPPEGFCPPAPPGSGACASDGSVCTFADGSLCVCATCFGALCHMSPAWLCAPPPPTAGCPALVPNDGSGCADDGLECTYGEECAGSGATARCTEGSWRWLKTDCPT
jgi:hypothetical protein